MFFFASLKMIIFHLCKYLQPIEVCTTTTHCVVDPIAARLKASTLLANIHWIYGFSNTPLNHVSNYASVLAGFPSLHPFSDCVS
jgi:hypothetical protein